jgi:phage FluMu protein Com
MLSIWYCPKCNTVILKSEELFLPYIELKCYNPKCNHIVNTNELIRGNKKILMRTIESY